MKNLLCLLFMHDWEQKEYWYPHFKAKIVQGSVLKFTCRRCGKEEIYHWDWKEHERKIAKEIEEEMKVFKEATKNDKEEMRKVRRLFSNKKS